MKSYKVKEGNQWIAFHWDPSVGCYREGIRGTYWEVRESVAAHNAAAATILVQKGKWCNHPVGSRPDGLG